MFIQQKNNAICKVSLTLDKVLEPFWNLSRHLLGEDLLRKRVYSAYDAEFEQVKLDRIEKAKADYDRICESIKSGGGSPEEKKKWLEDEDSTKLDTVFMEAFNCIHKYYLGRALSPDCFNRIDKSCSLIIYKENQEECWFVTEDRFDSKFEKEFKNSLALVKLVDHFVKFLNGGFEDETGYNPKIYANLFPNTLTDNAVSIMSPIYLKEYITAKEGTLRNASDFKVWFNTKLLKTLGNEEPQEGEVFEYTVNDSLVAIEKGQYLIPMVTDWKNYFNITNEAALAWTDYKNRIYSIKERDDEKKQKPAKTGMTPAEKEFVDAAVASEDFTNLLSYLTDNLYLSDGTPEVPEAYNKFFDFVLKVENLRHLSDYKIYVPKQDEGTVLGVYKIHKLAGETDYNLRHMLYSERNGEATIYKDYNEDERTVNSVKVLKPQYASFYMMDYYEFFVEEVLKSLKQQGVIKGYLRNQRFKFRGSSGNQDIEVDALVFNGQKIFLLELKTTLHIEFLYIFPQKYSIILENENQQDIYKFYLISSFAEDKIAILRHDVVDGYNVKRDSLFSVPYRFEVPIPVKDGSQSKELHCLAESSYDKLKAELTRVFTA